MWIIPHKNHSLCSRSVPVTGGSNWDLNLLASELGEAFMWRGNATPPPLWSRRLKRVPWLRALCTRILQPSQQKSFEAALMEWSAVIRVNPSQPPDAGKDQTTQKAGISGPTLRGQLSLFDQDSASLRMSKDTLPSGLRTSATTWENWVMSIRQDYLARRSAEHRTKEKESSSSHGNPPKHDLATNWPTPTAAEGLKIPSQANYGQQGLSNHPAIVGRPDRAKLNKSGKPQGSWATPTVMTDSMNVNKTPEKRNTPGLATQAAGWSTPQARDYRSGNPERRQNPERSKNLNDQMGRVNAKLSPDWVAQLMGLTTYHSQLPLTWGQQKIELIGSVCLGME
jgi:hypothetical protein